MGSKYARYVPTNVHVADIAEAVGSCGIEASNARVNIHPVVSSGADKTVTRLLPEPRCFPPLFFPL